VPEAEATMRLSFFDKQILKIVLQALLPEAEKPATYRASVDLREEGLFLVLHFKAKDTVALRATLNTYLRWINSMMEALAVCSTL